MKSAAIVNPVLAALACVLAGMSSASAQVLQFSDRTTQAGLTAVNTFPNDPAAVAGISQLMLGGAAVGDFNNDGWQDIFVLGGPSSPDLLYINNHDGTFSEQGAAWGVNAIHWGVGVAVGDFNNDGWLDIFVTGWGTDGTISQHMLYRNNGNGTFTEVAAIAGVQSTVSNPYLSLGDGFGPAFGDYDLDGRLDLAVAGWWPGSGSNRLFHNNGDGTFTDTTAALNYDMTYVNGYSPRFQDMNADRYPELLWVADYGTSHYFINNKNGTFTEATAAAGVGREGNGMGQVIGDFNNDGLPDWYVTSIYLPNGGATVAGTGDMLYINQGNHHYTEVSTAAGVKQAGWAWGTVAADFRNIGREDLAATNGWQETNTTSVFLNDPTVLFLNNGDGTFLSDAAACGILQNGQGRGMITFDYDNDGRQDVLIITSGGPMTLYHNDLSGAYNYLRVFLSTRGSHGLAPNGYGAHVSLTTPSGTQHRWISGASNYLSQSELSAHFGLGTSSTVSQLRVDWPDGTSTVQTNVIPNRTMTVRSCIGDFNDDGRVTVQDIFAFLQAWFAHNPAAAINGGPVSVQNIFDFLAAWFRKCG